jgi:protein-S-isoprenylcysteine O-methyltransferase Ste14
MPLQPFRTAFQKRSRPTPNGDTTPMPDITTRADTVPIVLVGMPRWIERVFVWTGAALFAVSLMLTGWLYAKDVGRLDRAAGVGPALIDTLLLTAFAVHHSLFARPQIKEAVSRLVPERLVRSLYVWVASLLLIGVCLWWQPVGGTLYRAEGLLAVPFLLIQIAGLALIVVAVRAIRALELAGVHPPRPHADELQVRGAYTLVRHPLYLGWILAIGGAGHMTGDRLLFFLVTTLYIVVAIPWEERGLLGEFGAAYERYRAQVRWRIVPYLY